MQQNSSAHYGTAARFLHWGMALIIIVGLAGVESHELFPKGSDMCAALMTTHFQAGMIVLALVWLRIGVMVGRQAPPIRPEPPPWQDRLARSMHLAFYIIMIVSPIIGIIVLQASGKSVDMLGVALPVFVGEDKEFAKALREVHETIGNVMLGLITAHALAAIWHHAVKKDNVLLRMLPSK